MAKKKAKNKEKIKKLDDKSYGEYISALKDEKPLDGYKEEFLFKRRGGVLCCNKRLFVTPII